MRERGAKVLDASFCACFFGCFQRESIENESCMQPMRLTFRASDPTLLIHSSFALRNGSAWILLVMHAWASIAGRAASGQVSSFEMLKPAKTQDDSRSGDEDTTLAWRSRLVPLAMPSGLSIINIFGRRRCKMVQDGARIKFAGLHFCLSSFLPFSCSLCSSSHVFLC